MSPGTPPIEWTEEKSAVASHLEAVGGGVGILTVSTKVREHYLEGTHCG
jgi:hypothetical protein